MRIKLNKMKGLGNRNNRLSRIKKIKSNWMRRLNRWPNKHSNLMIIKLCKMRK